MIRRRKREREVPEPMLPLINVVFLLLIFFMLVASFSVYVPFPVASPDAATGSAERAGLTIAVSADGRIALGGSEVDAAELPAHLPQRKDGAAPEPVWLKADRAADADRVIAVMEQLRIAGVTEVRLITER